MYIQHQSPRVRGFKDKYIRDVSEGRAAAEGLENSHFQVDVV